MHETKATTEIHAPAPTTRKRFGRPMRIDAQKLGEILARIRAGAAFDVAAVGAGVAAETWRLYRRRHPAAQAEAEASRTASYNGRHGECRAVVEARRRAAVR